MLLEHQAFVALCKTAPETYTHIHAHQGREEWRARDCQHIVPLSEYRCAGFALQRSSGLPIIPLHVRRTSPFLHGVLRAIAGLGVVAFDVK